MSDRPRDTGIVDITSASFEADPAAGYARLREQGRVIWQQGARGYLITTYEDAARAYRSANLAAHDVSAGWRKIGRTIGKDYTAALELFDYMPFIYEGERHRQLRATMARAIAPFAGRSDVFDRVVGKRLAAVRDAGTFDLAADVTSSLVFEILSEFIALPVEMRARLHPLSNISWALDPSLSVRARADATAIVEELMPLLRTHVSGCLSCAGDSLVHHIEQALPADEADRVTATANLLAVILLMGNDAVAGCINFAVLRLLADGTSEGQTPQAAWRRLSDDAIRFSSPVGFSTRHVAADFELGGCPMAKDDVVVISPLAADRDPQQFTAPDSIGGRGSDGVGLAFAAGPHVCVGARLSRNIVASAFRELSDFPPLSLAGPVTYGPGKVVRTIRSLPVSIL